MMDIGIIGKKISTQQSEVDLLCCIATGGESGEKAFKMLIDLHRGFVRKTAYHYAHRGIPFKELEQAGYVGLLKAARSFNTSKGCRLLTYAGKIIKGEIANLFKERYGLPKTYSLDEMLLAEAGLSGKINSISNDNNSSEWMKKTVNEYLHSLDEIKARVVRLYFGFDGQALSIAQIAGLHGVEKEHVRQTLFTALRALLKPGRTEALDRFIKCYSIEGVVIKQERYDALIEKLTQEIWEVAAGGYALFHRELIYLIHFFDPVSSLSEEFHTGWNKRAEYYTRCIFDSIDSEEKYADITRLVSWLYHASLYIIIDVFVKIAGKCKIAREKALHSLLVYIFWQDIVYARIYRPLQAIYGSQDLQTPYLHFYFACFGSLFRPAELTIPDSENKVHLSYSKLLLLFYSSMKKEATRNEETGKNAFTGYSMTMFFGPVIKGLEKELSRIVGNVYSTSLGGNERKELLCIAYYFQRIFPYLAVNDESSVSDECVAEKIRSYSVLLENRQTMFRLGYQAGLRKILLNALEKYGNQLKDQKRMERFMSENNHFIIALKHRIRTEAFEESRSENSGTPCSNRLSFFLSHKNALASLLDFLQKNGGLNLLQVSGFKVLLEADIDFPLGYITGER